MGKHPAEVFVWVILGCLNSRRAQSEDFVAEVDLDV